MHMHAVETTWAGCRLWRFDLDQPPSDEWLAALSQEEQARAQRFRFAHDRRRYLAAHAAVRQLLSRATGLAAPALRFSAGMHGKPTIDQAPGLHFNLSHSHGIGALAIGQHAEVGVDVEVLRPVRDALAMADAQFGAHECRALRALPEGAARDHAFLRCWTRKEACVKAAGVGLSVDTRRFEAGVGAQPRDVTLQAGAQQHRLQVVSLAQDDGVLLALARHTAAAPRVSPDALCTELAA